MNISRKVFRLNIPIGLAALLLLILVSVLVYAGNVNAAEPVFIEDFDYGASAGDLTTISGGDWVAHSGTGAVQYAITSLSMEGYGSSGIGGSATFGSGNEDVNHLFPEQSSGVIYYSALVNLSSASSGGTYFFHLKDAGTTFDARIFAKDDSGNLQFGISGSSTGAYGTANFSYNTTYLVVASYDTATGNMALYVLDSYSASEPAVPLITNSGSPQTDLQSVAIRQGSGGPTGTIDGIRVADTWSDVVGGGAVGSFEIEKTAPALVAPGETFTYTLAITNSTGISTTGTVITDVVPANATFASASDGGTESGGIVSWTVAGDFVADTSIERTFVVTATSSNGVEIVNEDYGVMATEWMTMGVGAPVTTTVSPLDLSVTKTGADYGIVGETVMYTITLDNQGVADAENVVITDVLPISTTFDSSDMGTPVTTDPYSWDLGTVLSDTTSTYYLTVTVDSDVTSGTILTNSVTVATTTTGDDPTNNSDDWSMAAYEFVPIATARGMADDEIVGVEGEVTYVPGTYNYGGWALQDATGGIAVYYTPPASVNLGDTVRLIGKLDTYNGQRQFTSAILFDNLASGPEVVPMAFSTSELDAGDADGWLAIGNGVVSGLSCPSTESYNFMIDDGSGAATARVDSDTAIDLCAMGVTDGDEIGVIGFGTQYNGAYQLMPRRLADIILPEPVISKRAPGLVDPSELFTYTLTVDNYIGYDLTNAVITDTLPADTTFAYASDGGMVVGDVVSWTVPLVENTTAVSRTFAVTATSVAETDIVNFDYGFQADNWITTTMGSAVTTTVSANACGATFTPIYTIQGSGSESPSDGDAVFTEGVVTAVYQDVDQLNGFYIQDETGDGDVTTSDGIFVYTGMPATAGDVVRVAGIVDEYYDLTEITNVSSILVCGTGTITATAVSLPVATSDIWEQYEGMLIDFPQGLYVTELYDLGRYGEVSLSVNDRLYNPTNITTPGALANAQQDLNDRSRVQLDDTYSNQNRDPIAYPAPGLTYTNTLRGGDYVANLTGVLDYAFGNYRVQPVGEVDFTHTNPRTAAPEDVGDDLTVASFNVLNYFNGDGQGGGFPTSRGAESLAEFNRQRAKIISAIVAIDADVIGLMEIENDGYDTYSAIQDLVNGLNDATGAGTYAFIDPGVATIGTDEIAVGLIYKPASVTPTGSAVILDSTVDPTFNDEKNRPVLTQAFTDADYGQIVNVAVNHLKSKGSECDDLGDPDTGDGQGNCNLTRESAATALVNWLATDPTGSGSAYNLIIGDLNSYAMEDPIVAIEDGGYTNLMAKFGGMYAYSYVFGGQFGYLDHALASSELMPFVTGATFWHINADEPPVLDYNENYKSDDQIEYLYGSGPYRASDHDPVVIGLDLARKLYLPIFMKAGTP